MVHKVIGSKERNLVVVLMSDEEMNELKMTVQYFRAIGRGPRTMSAVMRQAFKEFRENHKEIKEYIEANRPLLEKMRSQQAQEAEKA
jgi:hypothetical protein